MEKTNGEDKWRRKMEKTNGEGKWRRKMRKKMRKENNVVTREMQVHLYKFLKQF